MKVYKPINNIKRNIDKKTLIPKYSPTDKQLELFSLIYLYTEKYREPPTLRYCANILGIQHIPVYDRIRGLISRGFLYKREYIGSYWPTAGATYLVKTNIVKLKEFKI